jgi:DNA-binding response OmpR family regulator
LQETEMNSVQTPGATILVVDPDPITAIGMAAVLDMQGYECHTACDAEAARRAAKSLPLDVIVCDIEMAANGESLCDELRTLAASDEVPIIFLAATAAPRTTAFSTYWLIKPFGPDALIDEVSKALWMPHLVRSRLRHPHSANPSAIPAPTSARRTGVVDPRRK